jgi:hypothetical protein
VIFRADSTFGHTHWYSVRPSNSSSPKISLRLSKTVRREFSLRNSQGYAGGGGGELSKKVKSTITATKIKNPITISILSGVGEFYYDSPIQRSGKRSYIETNLVTGLHGA